MAVKSFITLAAVLQIILLIEERICKTATCKDDLDCDFDQFCSDGSCCAGKTIFEQKF
jgi:hypothetical protein